MRRKKSSCFFILNLLLWVGLLQPDGFVEHTLVRYEHGLKPIQQFIVGNHVVIVAVPYYAKATKGILHQGLPYEALAKYGGQLQPYSISHTMSYVADYFIKIQIKDVCVCAAPDQKFYSCTRNDWVSAQALQISEQLLCGNGNIVAVDAVETVHKKQKMHTFTVDTAHIFCVTPYDIIAHNIEPVTTGITATLSVACPPAGAALAIGQVVAFGALACVMFCRHRRDARHNIKHDGCFTPESRNNVVHNGGCFQPMPDVPVVCDIKADKLDLPTVFVHEISKGIRLDKGCEFPAERQQPELYHAAQTQTDVGDKKRYDGPIYNRTEDWLKDFKHKDKLERSIYINQGKRAFEVFKDIDGCDGFKKGDFIVIDALHNDHLEVFGKNLKWKNVANLDGTLNEKKTEQGRKETRKPLQKG